MFSRFKKSPENNEENNMSDKENMRIPEIPEIPPSQNRDFYRVGFDMATGMTTLTVRSDVSSMTLSMPVTEVLRLIRMLDATLDYDISDIEHEDDSEDD